MRAIKFGAMVLIGIMLASSCSIAEKITDGKDDIYHWKFDENAGIYSWKKAVTSRDNIDIDEISYEVKNQQVELKLMVHGTIQDAEKIVYWAYYNTTEAIYYLTYTNGNGFCMGSSTSTQEFTWGNATALGNTITGTVNLVGTGSKEEFYGWAGEYTSLGDTSAEWWGDWAPQTMSPWYGTDGNGNGGNGGTGAENGDDNGGTPGFDIFVLIGSIAIAMIAVRKYRG